MWIQESEAWIPGSSTSPKELDPRVQNKLGEDLGSMKASARDEKVGEAALFSLFPLEGRRAQPCASLALCFLPSAPNRERVLQPALGGLGQPNMLGFPFLSWEYLPDLTSGSGTPEPGCLVLPSGNGTYWTWRTIRVPQGKEQSFTCCMEATGNNTAHPVHSGGPRVIMEGALTLVGSGARVKRREQTCGPGEPQLIYGPFPGKALVQYGQTVAWLLLLLLLLLSPLCVFFLQEQEINSSYGSPSEKSGEWGWMGGALMDVGPSCLPLHRL